MFIFLVESACLFFLRNQPVFFFSGISLFILLVESALRNHAKLSVYRRYWHICRALQMSSADPHQQYDNYNDATKYRRTGELMEVAFQPLFIEGVANGSHKCVITKLEGYPIDDECLGIGGGCGAGGDGRLGFMVPKRTNQSKGMHLDGPSVAEWRRWSQSQKHKKMRRAASINDVGGSGSFVRMQRPRFAAAAALNMPAAAAASGAPQAVLAAAAALNMPAAAAAEHTPTINAGTTTTIGGNTAAATGTTTPPSLGARVVAKGKSTKGAGKGAAAAAAGHEGMLMGLSGSYLGGGGGGGGAGAAGVAAASSHGNSAVRASLLSSSSAAVQPQQHQHGKQSEASSSLSSWQAAAADADS